MKSSSRGAFASVQNYQQLRVVVLSEKCLGFVSSYLLSIKEAKGHSQRSFELLPVTRACLVAQESGRAESFDSTSLTELFRIVV